MEYHDIATYPESDDDEDGDDDDDARFETTRGYQELEAWMSEIDPSLQNLRKQLE